MTLMAITIVLITVIKARQEDVKLVMLIIASLGTLTGFASALLSANGIIWTFLFGILDVICCALVTSDNGAWGDFGLHVFYLLPMQFVGIWQWRRRGAKGAKKEVEARRLTWKMRLIIAAASLGCLAVAYIVLYKIQEAPIADGLEVNRFKVFFDAAVLTFNVVGQILMSLAYMEQWVLWNIVNVSNIGLWGVIMVTEPQGDYTIVMFIKYCFYLINSINGLRIWLKLSRPSAGTAEVATGSVAGASAGVATGGATGGAAGASASQTADQSFHTTCC